MEMDVELLTEMYRRMVRIRRFEEAAIDLFKRGQVKGAVHPCVGRKRWPWECALPCAARI